MKNVLITGGSRGIGKAMVKAFTEAGYRVGFTYKNSCKEAKELSDITGAVAIRADAEIPFEIEEAVRSFSEKIGGVDVLINNVGISEFSLFSDITLEAWNRVFSVNVTSAFLFTKSVLKNMINNKWGRIINISSIWGVSGASCEVHYSASKAALIGMTKALAKELGPSGITVNAIAPGLIDTDMNKALSEEDKRAFCEDTPVSRMGKTEEIAAAAIYLASDGASFVSGDVLNVNGAYIV